ncbi:hypothetical protein F9948_25570 [Burkholderia thailandensis]|nr:hypothetical protein [Burkholderia thailandensis]MDD1489619.1 hypothetical protein [Burkholderia thailandensis]MDD1495693.1 hypothetical protein [Burkholderia thailandensis]TGB31543.1 hypothetical protein C6946_22500 [Burkholderia thailandensis]
MIMAVSSGCGAVEKTACILNDARERYVCRGAGSGCSRSMPAERVRALPAHHAPRASDEKGRPKPPEEAMSRS